MIAFGDVSGKGAAAALYGALISGLLRILAPRRRSPAQLIKSLNETLMERRVDAQYATLLVALWLPREKKLRLANAGAAPPLIYRRGEIIQTSIEGVPIGLLDDREYEEVDLVVEPGDSILFFSDGVEDQLNSKNEDFSRPRITRLLKKHGAEEPKGIVDAIFSNLDAFRETTPITDDQTVVVLSVQ